MKVEYEVQVSGVGCSVDLTTKDYSESLVLYTMGWYLAELTIVVIYKAGIPVRKLLRVVQNPLSILKHR